MNLVKSRALFTKIPLFPMRLELPYGHSSLAVHVPDNFDVDLIEPSEVAAGEEPQKLVTQALDLPLGKADWEQAAAAKSVAIAVNDKTRPVPHHHLLPPLLAKLEALGVPDEAITFYIAVGTHPPMPESEFAMVLPEGILARYTVVSHDAEDASQLVYLGETSRGTPVWVNRRYAAADYKIVVGNIEPHQFVGFSGGVKSAAIGLCGLQTINRNHTLMTDPASELGEYTHNPARQDVEDIGHMIGVDLALNAVLNQSRQIVHALAGEPRAVMMAGTPLARQICQVAVQHSYALLLVSPGGHPKDINVYQAQKGLGHAMRIASPGADVFLAAACPEGSGSLHYEEWMLGKKSYQEIIQQFKAEGFRIGAHKAYQIARDASRIRLHWFSEMSTDLASRLLLNPVADLQGALDSALADLETGDLIGVLPHAASTIPYLENRS
jgi:lactate racemase